MCQCNKCNDPVPIWSSTVIREHLEEKLSTSVDNAKKTGIQKILSDEEEFKRFMNEVSFRVDHNTIINTLITQITDEVIECTKT